MRTRRHRARDIALQVLFQHDVGRVPVAEALDLARRDDAGADWAFVEGLCRGVAQRRSELDALIAGFPAGTVSGAPKIRAMEIIDELEPTRRSVYTGAIGYLSFGSNLDLNIVIRTFLLQLARTVLASFLYN